MKLFQTYSSDSSSAIAAGLIVILVYAGIAVGLGFAGRAIMKNKGRSPGAGFCLGFFLGLIGLLIAALQSNAPQQMHSAYNPYAGGQQWAGQQGQPGYGPQGGYGSQPGYAPQGEYAPQGGYAPSGSYNPAADPFGPVGAAAPASYSLSAIFATVTIVGYAAAHFLLKGGYTLLFGTEKTNTIVGLVIGVGLCVAALVTRKPVFAGLAAGAAIGTIGVGLWGAIFKAAGDGVETKNLYAIPLDLLAIAGAVILATKAWRGTTDGWWKPTVLATAGVGFIALMVAARPNNWQFLLAHAVTMGLGLIVSCIGLLRPSKATGGLALGFAVFTVYYQLGWEWTVIDYHGNGALTMLFTLAVVVAGALGVMAMVKPSGDAAGVDAAQQFGGVAPQPFAPQPQYQQPAPQYQQSQYQQPQYQQPAPQQQVPHIAAHAVQAAPASRPGQWAADPYGRHQLRYFDGANWTDNVSNNGVQGTDRAGY